MLRGLFAFALQHQHRLPLSITTSSATGMRINSVDHKKRAQALLDLLHANSLRILQPTQDGRGFIDDRHGKHQLCRGVYTFLSSIRPDQLRRMVQKYTAKGTLLRVIRSVALHKNMPIQSSSMRIGDYVHRLLFHNNHCRSKAPQTLDAGHERNCRCPQLFGTGPIPYNLLTQLDQMTRSANQFMLANALVPVMAEQIIVAPAPACVGTRFDSLMRRVNAAGTTEHLVLVSWKTGGDYLFDPNVNPEGYKRLVRKKEKKNEAIRNKHVAQVIIEAAFLEKSHGIKVDEAYVVYLMAALGRHNRDDVLYRTIKLDSKVLDSKHEFLASALRSSSSSQWDKL